MNTKKKLNSGAFIPLLLITAIFTTCKNKQEEHSHSIEHHHSVTDTLVQTSSPNKQVLSNQATVKLQSGNDGKTMKAQGFIVPAQNLNLSVAARFGGRIEKLYVKFNNQYVKQGDKIMDIYSPSISTFQEEHLFLLKSDAENPLIEKSREKLRLLGITENQITQLEKNRKVALTVSVFSPTFGYVFFNTQSLYENSTKSNTSEMNTMSMQQNTSNENAIAEPASQIREGMYVSEGQTLFNINNLKEVWALISIANQRVNQIHENQSVEIVSKNNPSKMLNGKVALIEQIFEEAGQRFARVRIVLPNSNNSLKINSLVTAQFVLSDNKNFHVPSSAVYKTGLNAYVWVKTNTTKNGTGIFKLRKVIAGASSNGMTIIKSGLSFNEEIALQAGLMTDSETFLNEK
jgi:Cu(I)/Ag(I) efflux system membrane fusion protein